MIDVTIKYGLTKSMTVEVSDGTTVGQILGNANHKAVLGYPENVAVYCDGATLAVDDEVQDGDVLTIEKQATAKAA